MPEDPSLHVTHADRSVLGPLAEHRILTTPQVAVLLDVSYESAARRLRRMRTAGLLRYRQMIGGGPGVASITRQGLKATGSRAPVPTENLGSYRHDVGLGWLWLAARNEAFGALSSVVTERELRIADTAGRRTPDGEAHGLGLGLLGPHGHPQRHYPDLLLRTVSGHGVAVELELTAKSRHRMTRIMTAYATDARIDAVVYLVPNDRLRSLVSDAARRAGISDLVDVRRVSADAIDGTNDFGARTRTSSRSVAEHRSRASSRLRPIAPAGVER